MIEVKNSKKCLSSNDLWQIKIFNSLIKRRHYQDHSHNNHLVDYSSILLSPELLKSLLIRLKMKLNEEVLLHKDLLKRILSEQNLDFVKSLDFSNIQELMQLASYIDLPLQLCNGTQEIKQLNLLQFLIEFKKHRAYHQEIDFLFNLWNTILS